MAQIILLIAPNQQTGEPKRASALGNRPARWCQANLKLESGPIQVGTRIEVVNNQHVFVKVDEDEEAQLTPGLYSSDRTPAEVKQLLRVLRDR